MKILLDAMGGDNSPDAAIKGAIRAANEIESEVVLIGKQDIIKQKISELNTEIPKRNRGNNYGRHTNRSNKTQKRFFNGSTDLIC